MFGFTEIFFVRLLQAINIFHHVFHWNTIDDVFRWNTVCSFIDVMKTICFAGTFYDLILM